MVLKEAFIQSFTVNKELFTSWYLAKQVGSPLHNNDCKQQEIPVHCLYQCEIDTYMLSVSIHKNHMHSFYKTFRKYSRINTAYIIFVLGLSLYMYYSSLYEQVGRGLKVYTSLCIFKCLH